MGGKSKHTFFSFNLTCNHRHKILHTTCGYPARCNDKTIALYNKFSVGINPGRIINDHVFDLYDRDASGNLIKVKYKGAWQLVDNGYLNWSTIISTMKTTVYRYETRWSEWIESVCNDGEYIYLGL